MGPTWGPSEAGRTQMGPMSAPWTLLSGMLSCGDVDSTMASAGMPCANRLEYYRYNFSPCRIYSLWSSDDIWWHRSESTLAEVMACSLSAHLNQCWLIIKGFLWYSPESNFTRTAHEFNPLHVFKDCSFLNYHHISQGQWVNQWTWIHIRTYI